MVRRINGQRKLKGEAQRGQEGVEGTKTLFPDVRVFVRGSP